MKEAAKHDKSIVLKILMESFDDNPSVNYVIKQDEKRKRRIKELMSYSFEHCLLFGKVLLSENKDGCVMLLYPSLKKTTFSTLLLDIKFVFHIGLFHAIKAMNREKEIKRYHPTSPFCHLWFIGVLPSQQGKGIGNRLLNEVMASESLPIYLETSVKNNISWYERKGFHSFQELNFPQSKDKTYTLTLMKK